MVRMRKNRLAWALALVVALVAVVCLAPGLARAVTADAGTNATSETVVDATSEDSTSDGTEVTDVTVADGMTVDGAGTDAAAEQDTQTDEVTTEETVEEDASATDAVSTLAVEPLAAGEYWGQGESYWTWYGKTDVYWVLAGNTLTIPGSSRWNSNSSLLTYSYRNDTWTASSNVSEVTLVTLSRYRTTRAYVVVIPQVIKANTYLRYDNNIPNDTLDDDIAANYGPNGDDSYYEQVEVDIESVITNGGVPYVRIDDTNGLSPWVYFSFESDTSNQPSGDRTQNAIDYWDKVVSPSVDTDDLNELYSHFPADSYFGYVLKKEGGDWHIDGALKTEPPVYTVDVYQSGVQRFLVYKGGEGVTGVDYDEFLQELSECLEADAGSLSLTQRDSSSADVTFMRDGVPYTCAIGPFEDTEAGRNSAIYTDSGTFKYYTVTERAWYLCQLEITEPVATNGTLTISKQVEGDAANVNEHFEFTLSVSDLDGEYDVTWEGNSDTGVNHPNSVTFSDGKATIELCHGESATISLPAGTEVSIVETRTAAAGTTTTAQVDSGEVETVGSNDDTTTKSDFKVTIPTGDNTHVAFTNEANLQPQTGISNNTAPMIGLLAVAGVGAAAVIAKRHSGKRGEDAWEE